MRAKIFIIILLSLFGMSLPAQEKATKSNLTVKEWNIDAGTNQKVLDHLTIYNASGRKVEEAEYDRKGQKWRKKYEYAPDGSLTRVWFTTPRTSSTTSASSNSMS